jgi:hypothetical protein
LVHGLLGEQVPQHDVYVKDIFQARLSQFYFQQQLSPWTGSSPDWSLSLNRRTKTTLSATVEKIRFLKGFKRLLKAFKGCISKYD